MADADGRSELLKETAYSTVSNKDDVVVVDGGGVIGECSPCRCCWSL